MEDAGPPALAQSPLGLKCARMGQVPRIIDLPAVPPSGGWWVHICLGEYKAVVDGDHYIVGPWRRVRDAMLDPKREPRPADVAKVTQWLQAHPECWSD